MKTTSRLWALAAAILACGAAQAADLPRKAPIKTPVVQLYNWTGFYVGAHAGAGFAHNTFTDIVGGLEVANFHATGYVAGMQAGYNWQAGSWVLGAEVEGSYAHIRRGVGFGFGFGGTGFCGQFGGFGGFGQFGSCGFGGFGGFGGQFGARIDAIGLFSGRVGYAFDRTMLYVKAGGALVHEKYVFIIPSTALTLTPEDTRLGWIVGAGVEYGLAQNWSLKLEYNYIDLGKESVNLTSPAGIQFVFDQSQQVHLVKAGVNYRF